MGCRFCLKEVPLNFDSTCQGCQARIDKFVAEELGWKPDYSRAQIRFGVVRFIPGLRMEKNDQDVP